MGSALTTVALPLALALVMFGLGLSLTLGDFARVGRQPKAVVIALALQLLVLPAVCFGLVLAFDLPPLLAVGLMLLAASPGGTTANLFSHLFRGDVALNITLTAVNSLIAVVTLPLITNLAIAYFDPADGGSLGLQFGKTAAGVRDRARAGRARDARAAAGRPRSPTAWTSRCASPPRWCSPWSSSARSWPSGTTSAATSATSACPRCSSA